MGPEPAVEPTRHRRVRPLAAAGLAVACLAAAAAPALVAPGCLTIDGGAIEVSWVTYCANGKKPGSTASCSCNLRAAQLDRVRVEALALGDGADADACAERDACVFTASVQSGVTGFIVPPGDYAIGLVPLDVGGAILGGPSCVPDASAGSCWQTPARIRRTVLAGEVVSLGSLLIAVPDCPVAEGCTSGDCPAVTP
jgi:hypothetical protein